MTTLPLPCIRCDKPLESVFADDTGEKNQPYAGTAFYSHGHYGSTAWDPPGMFNREFLELNVCDECLVHAGRVGKVVLGYTETKSSVKLGPWDPDNID